MITNAGSLRRAWGPYVEGSAAIPGPKIEHARAYTSARRQAVRQRGLAQQRARTVQALMQACPGPQNVAAFLRQRFAVA